MSRSNRLLTVLAALSAVLLSPSSALPMDDSEQPFKFYASLAPSIAWPRLNELSHSLNYSGNVLTNEAYSKAGATGQNASGFRNAGLGWGGQLAIGHEFNEEIRGGVQFGLGMVSSNDELYFSPVSSCTCWSSTEYFVSENFTLPVFTLGVFFQRVFRFEETPRFRLYMGAWGNYGMLAFASLKGEAHNNDIYPYDEYRYEVGLDGWSWGAGGLFGIEYDVNSFLSAYLESGYDYFIIKTAEMVGTVDQYLHYTDSSGERVTSFVESRNFRRPRLLDSYQGNIPLDFSGVFIRAGMKMGLGF